MKNFGDLLDSIYFVASKKYATNKKNCASILKECIKTLKTDNILSDQFTIHNNLKNSVLLENEINDYISHNINSLRKYKTQNIIESNLKLERLLKRLGGKVKKDKVNESIFNLCFLMNTAKNVNSLHESRKIVKEALSNNKEKENRVIPSVPIALLSKIVSRKYNEKYSDLTESDKKLLKVIIDNKEGDEKLFQSYKKKATEKLTKKIVENDDPTLHTNLKKSYKKVSLMGFIDENVIGDISKLHYLIEGLE